MGTGKKGISRVNQNGGVYKQIMQELQMTGLLSLSGNSETSLPFITFNFAKNPFLQHAPPPPEKLRWERWVEGEWHGPLSLLCPHMIQLTAIFIPHVYKLSLVFYNPFV